MKTVTVKAYAKLNIALNVLGLSNGYHMLDTICTTVNKCDVITATKRSDNKILVSFVGKYGFVPKAQEETNAYKAASAFIKEFNTNGVNLEIVRNIPTGSGMGGSSADIVGVLKALKKLYGINKSIEPLATSLGSDCTYLLKGGVARLTGRGEIVEGFNLFKPLYFVVIYSSGAVTAKDCFLKFDQSKKSGIVCDVLSVKTALESGNVQDINSLKGSSYNALTESAVSINNEIATNLQALKELSPTFYSMTGSGSTVFAMYEDLEMAKWALSKLKRRYGSNVEILKTHNLCNLSFFDVLFNKDYYLQEI